MPVNLPSKQPIDTRLIELLGRIAGSDGNLCIADEEYEDLEEHGFFQDAERQDFVRIDRGGEWSTGAVITITTAGRRLIGHPEPISLWKRLEIMFRGRAGG